MASNRGLGLSILFSPSCLVFFDGICGTLTVDAIVINLFSKAVGMQNGYFAP